MKRMNELKCILDIPADEYHADARAGKFLSSHLLGDFRSCPLLYHKKMTGKIPEDDSSAFTIGRAAHTLILEGRSAFDEQFSICDGPINPKTQEPYGRTTKAYTEWVQQQDKPVVSTKDFGFLVKLQTAVWLNGDANELLGSGLPEGTVRSEYCGGKAEHEEENVEDIKIKFETTFSFAPMALTTTIKDDTGTNTISTTPTAQVIFYGKASLTDTWVPIGAPTVEAKSSFNITKTDDNQISAYKFFKVVVEAKSQP